LIATGVFMACAWGSKVNGVLTVVTIGVAVVVDLWDLLDIRRNPSMVGVCSLLRMSLSYLSRNTSGATLLHVHLG
jgi:dolichyl-phosphate-mannose--protein O-mannosyl transferase